MTGDMHKGYVVLRFEKEENEKIRRYLDSLSEEIFFYQETGGVLAGGKIKGDFHLTLFFGFDDSRTDKDKVLKEAGKEPLGVLGVKGPNVFSLKKQGCKILFLEVDDSKGILATLHRNLSKFEHYGNNVVQDFKPHITLGYIRSEIDPGKLPAPNFDTIKVSKLEYRVKDSAQ